MASEGDEHRQVGTTAETLHGVAARYGLVLGPDALEAAERAFVAPQASGSVPLPGMLDVVHKLREALPLAVASNTRSHLLIENILRALRLDQAFDVVVTSAGCGGRKPCPKIFEEVLTAWRVSPETLIMIGDNARNDIAGASAVGLQTIWLRTNSTDEAAPDAGAVADLPEDILRILDSWGLRV